VGITLPALLLLLPTKATVVDGTPSPGPGAGVNTGAGEGDADAAVVSVPPTAVAPAAVVACNDDGTHDASPNLTDWPTTDASQNDGKNCPEQAHTARERSVTTGQTVGIIVHVPLPGLQLVNEQNMPPEQSELVEQPPAAAPVVDPDAPVDESRADVAEARVEAAAAAVVPAAKLVAVSPTLVDPTAAIVDDSIEDVRDGEEDAAADVDSEEAAAEVANPALVVAPTSVVALSEDPAEVAAATEVAVSPTAEEAAGRDVAVSPTAVDASAEGLVVAAPVSGRVAAEAAATKQAKTRKRVEIIVVVCFFLGKHLGRQHVFVYGALTLYGDPFQRPSTNDTAF